MILRELFHLNEIPPEVIQEEPIAPEDALRTVFGLLTQGNEAVAGAVSDCIADTRGYFSAREDILEGRGLQYSPEAEPWLRVIAAAEACEERGFLVRLDAGCSPAAFTEAVRKVLKASGIVFSVDRLVFDKEKNLAAWTGLFNEYAGQSGITLYFVELYGEGAVMGVSEIADYAEAAETAGFAGLKITCRPG
ncbi:MAG: hypothetical protein IJM51_01715 [Clostridia bacterium]|nr:hypothetical protein [Clostridia bacterium]